MWTVFSFFFFLDATSGVSCENLKKVNIPGLIFLYVDAKDAIFYHQQ